MLTDIEKENLFQKFRKETYKRQNGILMRGINIVIPTTRRVDATISRKQSTYEYSLDVQGILYPACRQTFMSVYGVTNERIKVLVKKMKAGGNFSF